jgi:ABC-type transporter Mla MlaB component
MSEIILPAIMDKGSLSPLAREMAELCDKGAALDIDGAKVSRVGLAGLQLLASAALAAKDRSVDFRITNPSEELLGAVSLSGLSGMFGLAA